MCFIFSQHFVHIFDEINAFECKEHTPTMIRNWNAQYYCDQVRTTLDPAHTLNLSSFFFIQWTQMKCVIYSHFVKRMPRHLIDFTTTRAAFTVLRSCDSIKFVVDFFILHEPHFHEFSSFHISVFRILFMCAIMCECVHGLLLNIIYVWALSFTHHMTANLNVYIGGDVSMPSCVQGFSISMCIFAPLLRRIFHFTIDQLEENGR